MFCFETDATVSCDTLGPLRDLVFGAWDEVPADCAQNRGGGWWNDNSSAECAVHSNLNGIYPRCGKETLAAIHRRNLDSTSAERSASTSTEMKIRPVNLCAWLEVYMYDMCICLINAVLEKKQEVILRQKTPINFFQSL